jgi:hypothetical protein
MVRKFTLALCDFASELLQAHMLPEKLAMLPEKIDSVADNVRQHS